ncbi:MAG: hypothetical protein EA384_05860 [Spirochaetaceae bacterium]|nr:MAG: hypothetical protein EA384_05860 [Spirochaetaceae bacterium]
MRRLPFSILAALIAASIYAGGAPEAARPQGDTLRFALSGNPDTLDPQATQGTLTFQVLRSVYDTLVEPDHDGRIVPALAESWQVSTDNLSWTFQLRRGVSFHNGDRLTAADVAATFARLLDPGLGSPHAKEFASLREIRTPDEYTVVFELDHPYSPLLSSLATGWSAILPRSLIAAQHDFAAHPVGTGPFRFEQWIRDNRIALLRNPDYWIPAVPIVERVHFNIITEVAVQVQGVLTGDLHIIDMVGPTDIARIERDPRTRLDTGLSSLVMVLAINTRRDPLSDLRLRRAINHAVDKQSILDVAYAGGKVIGTFMDYGDPYYVDLADLYPYNPQRARRLVAEAGAAMRTLDLVLPQNYEPHVRAGEMYQQMLAEVGFDVRIRLVDWSTWLADVYAGGNFDLTVIGHTGKLDPDGRLSMFESDNNYVGWTDPHAAEMIRAARRVAGFEERRALYRDVLQLLAEQVPFVFVGSNYRYIAMRENVEGFHMDAKLDTYDLRRVRLR